MPAVACPRQIKRAEAFATNSSGMFDKLLCWIYIVYCFEIGSFLLIFPWLSMWEDNYFLYHFPALKPILLNNFIRGGISGLGLVDIFIGGLEVINYRKRSKKNSGA